MDNLPSAKAFGRVVVLYGGHSTEREVSLNSGQAVYQGLCAYGIDAHLLDTQQPDALSLLCRGDFDRAFIVLHGRGGEDGQIQAVLDMLGMPYTGSDMGACALAMDKLWTKAVWQHQGLPVLPDVCLCSEDTYEAISALLDSPTFVVKPALEGSSVGVSRVDNAAALSRAYQLAGGASEKVMAEPWIDGRELTYAILGNTVLPGIEITASQSHVFYDYNAKYLADDTRYLCPAPIDAELDRYLRQTAFAAFRAVGARTWGRVDYLLDKDNQAWLLEINMVPGMTSHSLVPLAAQKAGMDFMTLVVRILSDTLVGKWGNCETE